MSTQVKWRRDTAAAIASFVGAQGEVLFDTTNYRLVLQDGTTAGGFPLANLHGTQTFSGPITFSSTSGTFGTSTAASTYGIGTGATVAAATKTVNIGTSGVATSVTNINIGSLIAGALGTLTIGSPTVTFGSTSTVISAAFANASFLYTGIGGATADATNRLSINSPAALFNHAGASFNAVLNKNAAANDASLTFQVGFSARALVGLLGQDDFVFKVSPDGSAYFSGIRTHRLLHGRVSSKSAERRLYQQWQPRVGAAAIDQEGLAATITGTLNVVTPAASNLFTQSPRTKITSAATAGSAAAANGSGLYLWRGSAADQGGFYLRMVGGIETFQATSRGFMGLYSSAAVIGNVNPSTLLNVFGIGWDSADTTMSLINNDATAGAVKTSLGANFPTTGGQDLYELILSAEPNGSEVRYRVERLNSGHVAEGTVTTRLPVNTVFMTPHFWYNNGTTAAAVEWAVHGMYSENASMLGSRGLLV
jgi:Major tropism determinant N-terminal domain